MSRARTLAGAIGSDGALNVADVAGLAAVASSGSASDLTTGTLPNARLASGAAAANLGFTPVNKAGDTMTGALILPDSKLHGLGQMREYQFAVSAASTQARQYEIARYTYDTVNWNWTGVFEVELWERYYGGGFFKRYMVYAGIGSSSGAHCIEVGGAGSNTAQVVVGSQVQVSGNVYYVPIFVQVRDYATWDVVVRTNHQISGTNPPPGGYAYIYESPSASNISDFSPSRDLTIPATNGGNNPVITRNESVSAPGSNWYTVYTFPEYASTAFMLMVSYENNDGDGQNVSAIFVDSGGSSYGGGFGISRLTGSTSLECRRGGTTNARTLEVRHASGGSAGSVFLQWYLMLLRSTGG